MLSLPVVRVRMYGFLLRDVVRIGCCYCASLEVLHREENQVSWDAALMLPMFLCWGDAPEELWDQLGCAGTEPLPASDGMLSGLLRIEMLPSVTCNPFALQSCCLSRLKEKNFYCFV